MPASPKAKIKYKEADTGRQPSFKNTNTTDTGNSKIEVLDHIGLSGRGE